VRLGRPYDRDLLTRLISDVGAPCLIFSQLVSLSVSPEAFGRMVAASLASFAVFGIVGAIVLAALRLPRHTYLAPLVFTNCGNMGLPVCLLAFGEVGLSLGIAYFAVGSILTFTLGPPLWSGRVDLGELLRTPILWSVAAALGVAIADVALPRWLTNTTELLGDFAIPLMLMTLGVSLDRLEVQDVVRSTGLAALRIVLGFATGVAVAAAFGLDGAARGVLILQGAMPPAVFNHLFAQRYGRSPGRVASVVVISTLMAFAALPFLLQYVLSGSGR